MLMPHVIRFIDCPVSQIEMRPTPAPVRSEDLQQGMSDLINSIKRFGLLQPVIVCELPGGKYELIAGRRRVLAHVLLQAPSLKAVVLDERPDPAIAGAIWAAETLVRNDPTAAELVGVMAALITRFGSAAAVSDQTGIPLDKVQRYSR
jgi:ParB family chromosome partitioning protein